MIVSDASPLIAFAAINQLDLLRAVLGNLVIPDAVACAVRPSLPLLPAWISTVVVEPPFDPGLDASRLGLGETAVLELARRGGVRLVVLDDREGRRGVASIGSAGIVALAKEAGTIDAAGPILVALRDGDSPIGSRWPICPPAFRPRP